MGIFKIILLFILISPPFLKGETSSFEANRILFMMTQGKVKEALTLYTETHSNKHDYDLLQKISLLLLDRGIKSTEPEEQLMAIFGASIANNDNSYYLLEEGIRSSFPQIQLVALNFLSKTQNDDAYELINSAMSSPYPLIRLEAAYQLAQKKHPKATAQIEALMQKIDSSATFVFPQLFALVGDDASMKILRKLMHHTDHEVRVAAILSAVKYNRDDLLPSIRKLAKQHDVRQQEACAMALGFFKDQSSLDILENLSQSPHVSVQIASHAALYSMGIKKSAEALKNLALQGNLFAIEALSQIPGSEETLAFLLKSNQIQIRLNATLALLELKDRRALSGLADILLRDMRDLAFTEVASQGKALTAWKAIPSVSEQGEAASVLLELSLAFREEILEKCLKLPEQDFLIIAKALFDAKQNDLIPLLVRILVNLDTPEAIALLKDQQQKAGAPLIRNYATLGLVEMKEEGSYVETLKQWVIKQQEVDILKFRTFVPFDMREPNSTYELTPQESARLLVESLETLSGQEDNEGVDLLLQVLKEGHQKNRYVVAGLLLRAVQ